MNEKNRFSSSNSLYIVLAIGYMLSAKVLKYRLLLICLLASAVRLIYAIVYTPWIQAPDHLSYELLINTDNWNFAHLIHYPHEGATIFVTLFARILKVFTGSVSLAVVAFLIDFALRYVQLYVVDRVFGRKTLLFFGCWMLFPSPSLIPWAAIGFGLHSWMAVFPFILLYQLNKGARSTRKHLLMALFWGIACWMYRGNLLILPIYALFYLQRRERSSWWFLPVSLAVFAISVFIQGWFDPGFHVAGFDSTSIRGESFQGITQQGFSNLWHLFGGPLTASMVAIRNVTGADTLLRYSWIILSLTGVIATFWRVKFRKTMRIEQAAWLLTGIFFLTYAFSPFFYDQARVGSFVSYRHLMYILPLLVLLICLGWETLINRFRNYSGVAYLKAVLILFTVLSCLRIFATGKRAHRDCLNAGWVIGVKLGDRPDEVIEAIEQTGKDREEWLRGVGCGLAVTHLADHKAQPGKVNREVVELVELMHRYTEKDQPFVMMGIMTAFDGNRTPKIDPAYYDLVMEQAMKPIKN